MVGMAFQFQFNLLSTNKIISYNMAFRHSTSMRKKMRAASESDSAKRAMVFALLRQARELTRLQEVAPTLDEQIATA